MGEHMAQYNARTRGWGPWKEEWYSFCSAHQNYKKSCSTCQHGSWVNVIGQDLSSRFYEASPKLWKIWANRPFFNSSPGDLNKAFPHLNTGISVKDWIRLVVIPVLKGYL